MRNHTDWQTPTTPTFEAVERFKTSQGTRLDFKIHEVIQTKEATVLHVYSDDFSNSIHVPVKQFGLSHKGNSYNPVDVNPYILVKTYKGDDPNRPMPNDPRSKNGVQIYKVKEH